MKGLMVFSGGLAMWRGWRRIVLLREYVIVCAGSSSVDRLRKRWIDIMKDSIRKGGLDVRQARRRV